MLVRPDARRHARGASPSRVREPYRHESESGRLLNLNMLLALPLLVSALAGLSPVAAVVQGSSLPPSQLVHCYVCGDSGDMFPGQPPPSACSLEMLPELRACPSGYRGCLTTYDVAGHAMARSCVRSMVDECQVANYVVYCYCSGGKCNTHGVDQLKDKLAGSHVLSTLRPDDDDDDEDHDDRLEIGSGDFENDSEDEDESGEVDSMSATEKTSTTYGGSDIFISSSSEEMMASVTNPPTTPVGLLASRASSSNKYTLGAIAGTVFAYIWMRGPHH